MDEKKKSDIIKLVKEGVGDKAKRKSEPRKRADIIANITGNGNQVAGGDINFVLVDKPVRPRVGFTPDPMIHIQAPVTGKIQKLVYKLAEIASASGMISEGDARKTWWSKLNKLFGTGTYREIRADQGEQAITWLQQHVAMNRPKLKKVSNQSWRNEHYAAIKARSRQYGYSDADIYSLANSRLEVQIISLKQLNDTNLKKLYSIVMALKPCT